MKVPGLAALKLILDIKIMMFDVIAFDADDTLWHNESLFAMTQGKFKDLLAPYCSPEQVQQRLDETERRNLKYFGYGIKGFTLSMIETAVELTNGEIHGKEIQEILNFAKEMLTSPVQPLEGIEEVLAALSASYPLMLITKGDLFDQEAKLARSGLARYFRHIEILSEKTPETYQAILTKYSISPQKFLMIGNSLRSDILPVIEIGGHAVHIPYHITWIHEHVSLSGGNRKRYLECKQIKELPGVLGINV